MVDNKKSILEEALLDAKKIQAALDANTKEMLRSVAREEIDNLVRESLLREDDFEEEDITDDSAMPKESTDEFGGEEPADEFMDVKMGGGEEEVEMGGEEMGGTDDVDSIMGQEDGMDAEASFDGTEMDMTAASDDDVIAIYKKLSGDDEIEIVGDDIHLTVTEPGEYVVKGAGAGAGVASPEMGGDMADEFGGDDLGEVPVGDDAESEDSEFEISLDDETEESDDDAVEDDLEEVPVEDKDKSEDDEIEEQISQNRVAANRAGGDLTSIKGAGARGLKEDVASSKKLVLETKAKYNSLLVETEKLKVENSEFRQALKKFRTMLIETVVLNANLSYVAKLISEHSTTKVEKQSIIARFDAEVTNLTESKKLYKVIANELVTRKPLVESIEQKIIKEGTTGTSQKLNETTVYADQSTKRINDLIFRVENKNK